MNRKQNSGVVGLQQIISLLQMLYILLSSEESVKWRAKQTKQFLSQFSMTKPTKELEKKLDRREADFTLSVVQ